MSLPILSPLLARRALLSCSNSSFGACSRSVGRACCAAIAAPRTRMYTSATGSALADGRAPPRLEDMIRDAIRVGGPMPIATYMRYCLTHPLGGYYMGRDVFGREGDFITSPEISQVFGELVAVWFMTRWSAAGRPGCTRIVELGPGRGTLMEDILRTLSTFPKMAETLKTIDLVEASPALRKMQEAKLEAWRSAKGKEQGGGQPVEFRWWNSVDEVPIEPRTYTMLVAHEFFDALPIHIFERTPDGFREILVDAPSGGAASGLTAAQRSTTIIKPSGPSSPSAPPSHPPPPLRLVLSPTTSPTALLLAQNQPRFSGIPPGGRVEVSPESWAAARRVAELVCGREGRKSGMEGEGDRLEDKTGGEEAPVGGAALVVDYGEHRAFGNSFRAFKQHEIVDPLQAPGTADLTANVDFSYLRDAIEPISQTHGPLPQSDFLISLGLQFRLQALLDKAPTKERRAAIASGAKRLVERSGMGGQYKVLGVTAGKRVGEEGTGVYPFEN